MNSFLTAFLGILILVGAFVIFLVPNSSLAIGMLKQGDNLMSEKPDGYPTLTLAGGCFWCTESEYRALDGVLHTRVGYMGGALDNPTYQDITTGKTGHAEVVQVIYDPALITEAALLDFFLRKAQEPTQLNRQGVDVGTQYRSAVFYEGDEQKARAKAAIDKVTTDKVYDDPIVTTLEPLTKFWDGEEYHQQYYEKYQDEKGVPHLRVIMKQQKKLIGK